MQLRLEQRVKMLLSATERVLPAANRVCISLENTQKKREEKAVSCFYLQAGLVTPQLSARESQRITFWLVMVPAD
ncbi:hypothetical protein DV515_00006497, partial [Chloebia gouldiae]